MKRLGNGIKMLFMRAKGETSYKTILIGCAFVFLGAIMVNSLVSNIQLQYQKSQLSTEVAELMNQNKALEQKIEEYSTNQFIEEKARENLGMVKSNEIPIKIVEADVLKTEENKLKPNDKMGIYMNDWYEEIGEWIKGMKG